MRKGREEEEKGKESVGEISPLSLVKAGAILVYRVNAASWHNTATIRRVG